MRHKGVILDGKEYTDIVNSMYKFRRFSYNSREDWMNVFDQPGQLFFKILFHFDDGADANGLLGISDMNFNADRTAGFTNIVDQNSGVDSYRDSNGDPVPGQSYLANTAFHFLLRNNELTRANMLIDFVELLSEINSNHPWYWKSISGLEALMERKVLSKEVKIEDESPKITIKCLEDAYDSRIGTLLDLYRAICFDYRNKREIVPANLRKFDMDICIFQTPTASMHKIKKKDSTLVGSVVNNVFQKNNPPVSDVKYQIPKDGTESVNYTSCKIIELKNCEINFNSSKSGYGELTNDEGFKNEYSIEISVDDAYENRFNEVLGYNIGDFISFSNYVDDGNPMGGSTMTTKYNNANSLASKLDISSMVDNLTNTVVSKAKTLGAGYALGNIHTASLANISNFVSNPQAAINSKIAGAVGGAIDNSIAESDRRKELDSLIGKKLPGYPTFEEKIAQLRGRFNSNRNLFNSL